MSLRATLLLAVLAYAGVGYAQAWHESFETAQPSWSDAGGDGRYRILQHQRIQGEAHADRGCEWLQLEAEPGSHVFLAHDVGRPAIIEELSPSVWVKSDRPGLQFAIRIALPRTADPKTGRPLTTVISGPTYTDSGRWQQLQLRGIPLLLTRQVRILRMQYGSRVDDREAYVDAVLLNVYGGQGAMNLWIDDLEVAGHAAQQAGQTVQLLSTQESPDSASSVIQAGLTPVRLPPVSVQPPPAAPPRHVVRLDRSELLVDDRPMLPRVIQHRGEPLDVLKRIGFNAVWLDRLPAAELFEEADRLGLWLICPPPRPGPTGMADIGPQYDSVLAWDLGDDLTAADLEATQRWAEQVREADHRGNRPLICRPRTDLRGFSRSANLLLIDRRPLGTSLEMADYSTWVRQQPRLASLGTPLWTTVQTQPNESLRRQLMALEPGYAPPTAVSPEQIRLLAYTAIVSGSRGLVFTSDSPLDASDPGTQQRAMSLELLNLELELIEPWAAAGSFIATAEATDPEVSGAVLCADRAKLLLPLWFSPGAQYVPSQSAANTLSLVAPGVPEATSAFELTPNGVRPLKHQRVAGGMRVTLDEFGLTTQILLAQDPVIVDAVHRRAAQIGPRAAELQRQLAVMKLHSVQTLAGQLAPRTKVAQQASWFDAARKNLQTCDSQLAAGDAPGAALSAQRAGRSLRLIERAYWDAAVKGIVTPAACPGAMSFETLPCHWRLVDRLAHGRFGPNRIDGGDFEDMGTMMRAGWQHILHPAPTVQTAVDLVPQAAHGGRLGVRMTVTPTEPKKPPAAIENPPILFSSPAVQVEAGQLVCIHGWVRVVTDITASTDGLLVVDSLSGECLADRIGKTKGWRQFALYRVAPQSGPMCVTFAMSGLGQAWLDDVAIQVVESGGQ